jgi:hypothetical protein
MLAHVDGNVTVPDALDADTAVVPHTFTRDWEDLAAFGAFTQPSIPITGERDRTRRWMPADGHVAPGLRPGPAGAPAAVNALLLRRPREL